MMTRRPPYVLILLCALLTPNALADEPRQVMWADLVPKSAAMDNPFLKLTKEQLAWVSDVAAVRDRKDRGDRTLSATELENEQALSRKLAVARIDVGGPLAGGIEDIRGGRGGKSVVHG